MTLINDVIALAEERDQSNALAAQALVLRNQLLARPYINDLPPKERLEFDQTVHALDISRQNALQRAKWYQARIDVIQAQTAKRGPFVLAASNELQ